MSCTLVLAVVVVVEVAQDCCSCDLVGLPMPFNVCTAIRLDGFLLGVAGGDVTWEPGCERLVAI